MATEFDDFDLRLKEVRLKKGLTQRALGKLAGVSNATIAQWESGRFKQITLSRLIAISDALGVEPWDLITTHED